MSDTGFPSFVSKYSLTEMALIPSCSNMSPKMTSMVVLQLEIFIVVFEGFHTFFAAHPMLMRTAIQSTSVHFYFELREELDDDFDDSE